MPLIIHCWLTFKCTVKIFKSFLKTRFQLPQNILPRFSRRDAEVPASRPHNRTSFQSWNILSWHLDSHGRNRSENYPQGNGIFDAHLSLWHSTVLEMDVVICSLTDGQLRSGTWSNLHKDTQPLRRGESIWKVTLDSRSVLFTQRSFAFSGFSAWNISLFFAFLHESLFESPASVRHHILYKAHSRPLPRV